MYYILYYIHCIFLCISSKTEIYMYKMWSSSLVGKPFYWCKDYSGRSVVGIKYGFGDLKAQGIKELGGLTWRLRGLIRFNALGDRCDSMSRGLMRLNDLGGWWASMGRGLMRFNDELWTDEIQCLRGPMWFNEQGTDEIQWLRGFMRFEMSRGLMNEIQWLWDLWESMT